MCVQLEKQIVTKLELFKIPEGGFIDRLALFPQMFPFASISASLQWVNTENLVINISNKYNLPQVVDRLYFLYANNSDHHSHIISKNIK